MYLNKPDYIKRFITYLKNKGFSVIINESAEFTDITKNKNDVILWTVIDYISVYDTIIELTSTTFKDSKLNNNGKYISLIMLFNYVVVSINMRVRDVSGTHKLLKRINKGCDTSITVEEYNQLRKPFPEQITTQHNHMFF